MNWQTTLFPSSPLPGFAERAAQRAAFVERASSALQATFTANAHDPAGWVQAALRMAGPDARPHLRSAVARLTGIDTRRLLEWLDREERRSAEDAGKSQAALASLNDLFHHARQIRSGSEYAEMLNFLARHRRFSVFNNMLVYIQNPEARAWDDAWRWKKEGRKVREGARPLLILQPGGPFKVVYDIADTDGPPVPVGAGLYAAVGELDDRRMARTRSAAREMNILIREIGPQETTAAGFATLSTTSSKWDAEIALQMRVKLESVYCTLCHELAHIFLGHCGPDPRPERVEREGAVTPMFDGEKERKPRRPEPRWPDRSATTREVREVEAESTAFLVASRLGIVTPNAEYLAGYLEDTEVLARVRYDLVIQAASKIEAMGNP